MNNPVQQQQANPQQERPCQKRVIYHCEVPSNVLKKPEEPHSGEGVDSIIRRLAS